MLPPDPARMRIIEAHLQRQLAENQTIGMYLELQLAAVRHRLAATEPRAAGQPTAAAAPAATRPIDTTSAEWKVEQMRTSDGPLPGRVHKGDCHMDGKSVAIDIHRARVMLADGVDACPICRPDTALGID
ncbi:hypothetical protein GCM10020367_21120 [Streptomyces sannanensis]|uniref:Uncharacterized protein n=1 Tax=Streptomyces sannanensis TaxID=285536 RepID=A0ABP6S940_9ACTN